MEFVCMMAEKTYKKTPRDAENLTRWAVALLRLSSDQSFPDSLHTVEVSILKLLEAFPLNPKNLDVLWLLGMAFTEQAILTPDDNDAAAVYFKRAFRQDPSNPSYQFSSELADFKYHEQTRGLCPRTKAHDQGKHAKIHTHGLIQQSSPAISCFKGNKTYT
ncbi:putative plant specific mitochondrial import receptor subunit TOM20 [Medicago truncatula]|uniref:Putative plant specific mitochondrial import receptor subunit TOM20 n=1 Tax=Medicago truncatula TaxID=3880 RepID=A0A396HHC2_MEDTR|nr:putative plant specific mitochondrial import receptor subunit TOM20 [Medicago truncatula]